MITPFEITCVILSGGKSSRMGEDKSLLPFSSSQTLIQYQYDRLKPYFKNIYISSKVDKFNFLEKYSLIFTMTQLQNKSQKFIRIIFNSQLFKRLIPMNSNFGNFIKIGL